jgi:response regulator RpfG family c-di-GMP phosphodiesterase
MQLAYASSPPPFPFPPPIRAILAFLSIYAALSRQNRPGQRAVIKAREFGVESVRVIDEDEVANTCRLLDKVQDFTDEAVKELEPIRRTMTDAAFGSRVHKLVKDKITALADERLIAEESAVKLAEEVPEEERRKDVEYGRRGSIRIDAYERLNDQTMCIYDIKTGNSGLSFKRMQELKERLREKYGVTHFIVTEVKPTSVKRNMRGRTLGR